MEVRDENEERLVGMSNEKVEKIIAYEEKRRWYKEKYGPDLDEPHKDLKVSVVIPTFAELTSDNFWRMFRSLMYQRGASEEEFEVICVVNNSEEIANLPDYLEATSNKFEGRSNSLRRSRYKENQDQLKIIKIARQGQQMIGTGVDYEKVGSWIGQEIERNQLDVSKHEVELMNRFARSKVSLQYVDASSPKHGFVVDSETSPISLARDIGSFLAYDRFKKVGRSGLVDFIDGDCFLDPNYMKNMIDLFGRGADVVIKPLKKVVAEIPRDIEKELDPYTRVMSAINYLSTVFTTHGYYDIIEGFDKGDKTFAVSKYLGGPQIAVRSDHLPRVGGYPTVRSNGDWVFSKAVVSNFPGKGTEALMDSCVMMSDRGREISIDGMNRGVLIEHRSGRLEREYRLKSESVSEIVELKSAETDLVNNIYEIEALGRFKARDMLAEYEQIKKKMFEKNSVVRQRLIEKVERLLEEVARMDHKNTLTVDLTSGMYASHKIRASDLDFFGQNTVLVDLAIEVLKMSEDGASSPEDRSLLAMLWLENLLPEYFESPPDTFPPTKDWKKNEIDNVVNYYHIFEAVYVMKARLRERLLRPY